MHNPTLTDPLSGGTLRNSLGGRCLSGSGANRASVLLTLSHRVAVLSSMNIASAAFKI